MLRPKPSRVPPTRRPRPLLVLRRHPRLWWAVAGALALAAGLLVSSVVGGAEAARRAWGTAVTVVVATRDLQPGDPLDGAVALERRPRAAVPASALTALPEDRVAGAAIVAGEVLVAERLAGVGLAGPAALLPPGTRAMAIPADPALTPPLAVGDRVDVVLALAAAAEPSSGPPGFTLVAGALVVAVEEAAVTVAVPRADTPRVAVALGAGAVSLALIGQP